MTQHERYVLGEDHPNNAVIRHWAVLDRDDDYRPAYLDGVECWGMTGEEAEVALATLRGREGGEG